MDQDIPHSHKQNCWKNFRKIFIILLFSCCFFLLFWNINIPYTITMTGDDIFVNNVSMNNISGLVYLKKIYKTLVLPTPSPHINPHDFRYIILEKNTCQTNNKSVFLAVIACVAPANFRQRMTIRETWGSVANTNKEIAMVFMLGKTSDLNIQQQILNESNAYHDIIQEDFVDSYRNLSYKSVAMLKWSYTYCPSAQYVLKADDDMFVNLEYLLNVLKHKRLKDTVIGMQITGARPIQDKSSKWYTPKELFNGTVYPPYCSGTSYVISGDSVEKLYTASLDTPYFWLEDIFITGICRTKANIKISNDYGFTYDKPTASGCVFRSRITGHRYNENEIRKIWTELVDSSISCTPTHVNTKAASSKS